MKLSPAKVLFKSAIILFTALSFTSFKNPKLKVQPDLTVKLDNIFAAVPDFSGVLLVAEKGKPVYHKAFGYKSFMTKEPMETSTVFELASVSKQFTAMTIMQMKQEGKLSFDDLLEKYIPGLPYPGITIRHLLTHTSGLPDYQQVMDQHWDKTKIAGNAENIAYLIQYHPEKHFEPGAKYEYSNTGFMLLASITEKVSGEDFVEFCQNRLFKPAKMSHTAIRTIDQKKKLSNLALGHIYVPEKKLYVPADSFPQFNYAIWLGNRKGPGRVSSTSTDLLKWDRVLYSDKMVKAETSKQAFSPARLNDGSLSNYGFGWKIKESKIGKVVWHDGDNPGYATEFIRYIDADKTIILLCNNAHPKMPEILKNVETAVEE
ncbi:serine hydrolase domain-containing protein [Dyadobacter subterraneus]|uniref:Beta-lactamase family protein n=1 Tax=Dyadobacter subterraneus TaxID=2773304 RepID=A0ABR9W7P7_9BACT|nr:serine hydrolase domain-containing protein [Dyadobacter subterraneus]MBE9461488.1 beta-lactamase family protein [Dyadobacter subterraneus]